MAGEQNQRSREKAQENAEAFAKNNAEVSTEISTFKGFLYRLLLYWGMPWVILGMLDAWLDRGSTRLQGIIASDNAIVSDLQEEASSARETLSKLEKARNDVQAQPESDGVQVPVENQNAVPAHGIGGQPSDSAGEPYIAMRSAQIQVLDEDGVEGMQRHAHEEVENTQWQNEEKYVLSQETMSELEKQHSQLQKTVQLLEAQKAEIEARVAELEERLADAERLRRENEGRTVWQKIWAWIRWLSRCGSGD